MILPHIIEQIMVTAFYTKGVIGLNRLDEDDLEQIPILRQVVCLCQFIREENRMIRNGRSISIDWVVHTTRMSGNLPLYTEFKTRKLKGLKPDIIFFKTRRSATITG